jgi:hypothetical protein
LHDWEELKICALELDLIGAVLEDWSSYARTVSGIIDTVGITHLEADSHCFDGQQRYNHASQIQLRLGVLTDLVRHVNIPILPQQVDDIWENHINSPASAGLSLELIYKWLRADVLSHIDRSMV